MWDNFGSTVEPAYTLPETIDVVQDTTSNFSDVFRTVSAGTNDLLKVWQGVKTTENAFNQQQFQNELQAAKLNLDKTVALGRINVEQANATRAVEQARNQAVPNTVVTPRAAGLGVGAIAVAVLGVALLMRQGKKAAA